MTDTILLESGDTLLQENGYIILLEIQNPTFIFSKTFKLRSDEKRIILINPNNIIELKQEGGIKLQ